MYLLCVPFLEIMPIVHKGGWTFGMQVCKITYSVDNAYQVVFRAALTGCIGCK